MIITKAILAGLKSAEVLEGQAAFDYMRTRTIPGSAELPLDCKYSRYKDLEDGRFELFKEAGGTIGIVDKQLSIPSDDEIKTLAARRGVEWRDVYSGRALRSWGSDQRVDRHGDIVMQDWDFTDFQRNPAMPFNHNWDGLPVGVHLDWLVAQRNDATGKYVGPALLLTSLYAAEDEMPPAWGDSLFRLVRASMLRANSVGFIPRRIVRVLDEDERQRLGLGPWGDILADNLLLENSPTLLGANQGAMTVLTSAKSFLKPEDISVLRELNRRQYKQRAEPDAWKEEDSKYLKMARLLFPVQPFDKATDIEQPLFEAEIVEEELTVIVPTTEEVKATGEEMLLAKLQQLVGVVEMGFLSMQAQLDSIADALLELAPPEESASTSLNARQRAIELIRSIKDHELSSDTNMKSTSLAAELAALLEFHSS